MNLALFDFDGTITSTDTWTPFMRFAVRPWRMAAGWALLFPVGVGYRLGAVSAGRGREIAARVAFQGEGAAAIRQRGVEYAARMLPGTVRQSALDRIQWHKSQGDEVVVVSAALDVYLRPWCEAMNLGWICTTLEEHGGRLTGRCVQGDCSGAEKARRIKQRFVLKEYGLLYAYGDTQEDREMLELANKKYYRGEEVSSWDDVAEYGHPAPLPNSQDQRTKAG